MQIVPPRCPLQIRRSRIQPQFVDPIYFLLLKWKGKSSRSLQQFLMKIISNKVNICWRAITEIFLHQ